MPTNIHKSGRKIGSIPWNKGRKMVDYPHVGFQTGHKSYLTKSSGRKISQKLKGVPKSLEARINMSLGRPRGKDHPNWKNGASSKHELIRKGINFTLWREAVFKRDNWTCQKCKIRGGLELHPHHVLNFSEYPKLMFIVDNGITLCKKCHKEFHRIYNFRNNTREQINEFCADRLGIA